MRFRADSFWFDPEYPRDNRPGPEPGDTWRIHWYHQVDGVQVNNRLAGYAICCPLCKKVHNWTSANNCSQKRLLVSGQSCAHIDAGTSCWTWSGSAENNKLTASPSLHCDASVGGCGWHGHLIDGVLVP